MGSDLATGNESRPGCGDRDCRSSLARTVDRRCGKLLPDAIAAAVVDPRQLVADIADKEPPMQTGVARTGARRTLQCRRVSPKVGVVSVAGRTRSRRERATATPHRIARCPRRGFTLIETLLALALCV